MKRCTSFFTRKRIIWISVIILVPLVLFLARRPIMRGMGSYLTDKDHVENCDAIFVLGGNAEDRGAEAAILWHDGVAPVIHSTGSHVPSALAVLDTFITEAGMARIAMMNGGVPGDVIVPINEGTSTLEEAHIILETSLAQGYSRIMIVTTNHHTRRTRNVFEEIFEDSGIAVNIHGGPSSLYNEERWWTEEYGMIAVNNEYMKLLYYWWNY